MINITLRWFDKWIQEWVEKKSANKFIWFNYHHSLLHDEDEVNYINKLNEDCMHGWHEFRIAKQKKTILQINHKAKFAF